MEVYRACCAGDICLVKSLLSFKTVNYQNAEGNTPLLACCKRKRVDLIKVLLERENIDVNLSNIIAKTPLIVAIEVGCIPAIELLLEYPKTNLALTWMGNTAFHVACKSAQFDIIEIFLKKEIDVTISNNAKFTPLMFLCRIKHIDSNNLGVLREVVTRSNINATNDRGKTALHILIEEKGSLDTLKVLLEQKDIDVNIKDSDFRTPIQALFPRYSRKEVSAYCRRVFALLLEIPSLDVNVKIYGNTLLEQVMENGSEKLAELLLDDPRTNVVGDVGISALKVAASKCAGGVTLLLNHEDIDYEEAEAYFTEKFHNFPVTSTVKYAVALRKRGFDLDSVNLQETTLKKIHEELSTFMRTKSARN